MVPRVTSQGRSFKGAGAYFLHDLGRSDTAERVAFTHTVNMLTDEPETAIKVMSWTAAHAEDLKALSGQKTTGRKAQNPVYNYCLAWAPDQNPTREEMVEFGLRSMQALGVEEHEALFVAHDDTPHKHLHVILNRVHPVTGLMAKMGHDRNLLSRLSQAYEEETGRIYCPVRVANNQRRDLGDPNVKADNVIRLMESPEYQARRSARVQAQREAGARALARDRAEAAQARAARDLRADFDQAASADDRLYRAREIELPSGEEAQQAKAAWLQQQQTERDEGRAGRPVGERDERARHREQARRAWLDARRDAEWQTYEARQWQQLNDRHTGRRETLNDRLQAARARHDVQLDHKYADTERYARRRVTRLAREVAPGGLRGMLDKLTGRLAERQRDLDAARASWEALQRQKNQEREALASKHQGQREAEQQRQRLDRERLTERLAAERTRREASFLAAERARTERLAAGRSPANDHRASQREAARKVAREHVEQVSQERAERAQWAEFQGPGPARSRGRGYGP